MFACEYCKKNGIYTYQLSALDAVLFGKMTKKDFATVWQEQWDEPSGVIWRNYSNIRLKLLDLD